MKQQSLFFIQKAPRACGGSLQIGKRKAKRSLSTKQPIHLVLRSTNAKGICSFVNHKHVIESLITRISHKHQVKVYGRAVTWDHLHFVIRILSETAYKNWIRELTRELVLLLSNRTGQKLSKFFNLPPYTRLLTWGREFSAALHYQELNQMEIVGLRPKKYALGP